MSFENPNFLKKKYDLHKSPEVESAASRTEKRTGEKVPQKPEVRIQNYLDRFKEITERTDPDKRERGITALKTALHDKFVIKPGQIPQSYYDLQGEIAVREGRQADLEQSGVEITTQTVTDKEGNEKEVRHFTFPQELQEQHDAAAINNQTRSLDKWVDYLASDDAQYTDWAKYWALRSVLDMGKLEKVKDDQGDVKGARFGTRIRPETDPTTGRLTNNPTVASFSLLNPRALAKTISSLRHRIEEQEKVQQEKQKPKDQRDPQRLKMQIENMSSRLDQKEFEQLLSTENFSKLYAQNLIELPEYSPEALQETRGAWVTFPQEADPMVYRPAFVYEGEEYTGQPLVPSIENYPLEWCTADPDTARTQLEGGDFHVYYSVNDHNEPVIPRLAIRMEGERIAEPPRGIAPDQNIDPYIAPVLEEKLGEFGVEGEAYKKRVEDMQRLTEISDKFIRLSDSASKYLKVKLTGNPFEIARFSKSESKQLEEELEKKRSANKQITLSRGELLFLYEIESPIEGFGYQRDPRIEELRETRNPQEDARVVLSDTEKPLKPEEIASTPDEINENTKAYIGKIADGERDPETGKITELYPIYKNIFQKLAHVPHIFTSFPEGRIRRGSVEIGTLSRENIEREFEKRNLKVSGAEQREQIDLVKLTVADLGLPNGTTIEEIYQRADKLSLDLCPAEVGPRLHLREDTEQRFGEWFRVAMKQIPDSSSRPCVFCLRRSGGRRWLDAFSAGPDRRCRSGDQFVFRLRPSTGSGQASDS